MSIVRVEGFGRYDSISSVQSALKYTGYQSPVLISSTDTFVHERDAGNETFNISPRSDSSIKCDCWIQTADAYNSPERETFQNSNTYAQRFNPSASIAEGDLYNYNVRVRERKFAISGVQPHSSGILGFAYYDWLPTYGSYAPFTPIACIADQGGKPHLFVCVNGSRQIEIRRWNTSIQSLGTHNTVTASGYTWNAAPVAVDYSINNIYCTRRTVYHHHISTLYYIGTICDRPAVSSYALGIRQDLFELVATANEISLNPDSWNYIEIEYLLSSGVDGYVKIRVNKNNSSSYIDASGMNIQTTSQTNIDASQFVFAGFWRHAQNGNSYIPYGRRRSPPSAGLFSWENLGTYQYGVEWPFYYDDIYIIKKDNILPNDFLGSVSCLKVPLDTIVSNTAVSGDLTDIDEVFNGTGVLGDYIQFSSTDQHLRATSSGNGIIEDSDNIVGVQQFIYARSESVGASIGMSATFGNQTTTEIDSQITGAADGAGYLGPFLSTDPSGNPWTGATFKATTFNYEAN